MMINLKCGFYTRYRQFAPQEATGIDERFADPEVSPVASFSSRGPCYINSGGGLEERLKPVTTAANGVETSTGTPALSNVSNRQVVRICIQILCGFAKCILGLLDLAPSH